MNEPEKLLKEVFDLKAAHNQIQQRASLLLPVVDLMQDSRVACHRALALVDLLLEKLKAKQTELEHCQKVIAEYERSYAAVNRPTPRPEPDQDPHPDGPAVPSPAPPNA